MPDTTPFSSIERPLRALPKSLTAAAVSLFGAGTARSLRGLIYASGALALAACAHGGQPTQGGPGGVTQPAPAQPANPADSQESADGSSAGEASSAPAAAVEAPSISFDQWLQDFSAKAAAASISQATIANVLQRARLVPRVMELDGVQPEFSRPVWAYLDSALSEQRVRQGQALLRGQRDLLAAAQARYGVPPEIIVAIWGIESNFGSNFGDFSTINALATLAYEGRRRAWAERELLSALRIIDAGDIDAAHMRGSWAGAMGHTQFMPSSFERYAVDGDGDGKRDIWNSIPDVVFSTANYLASHGWQRDQPWATLVRLPAKFDYALTEISTRKPAVEWANAGVLAADGTPLPDTLLALQESAIITPAGARGPAFLVGPNFRVILKYNNSTSYALAVSLLAQRLAGSDALPADSWPRDLQPLSRTQIRQLQTSLSARGYDAGSADGVYGPSTRGALRAFQRAQGLLPDGFPTLDLLARVQTGS